MYSSASVTLDGSATDTPFASLLQLNGNSATEDGGAIYNREGVVTLNNAVLSVNRTPTQTLLAGFGGAIYSGGALTLTQSIVARNEGRFGGGVFVGNSSSARAVIDHVLFLRNVSGNRGGGLYTNDATTVITVSISAFYANTAQGGGGGLARFNAALGVFDSSFTQNTAAAGGGLFLGAGPLPSSGPYVHIQSITVSSNTSARWSCILPPSSPIPTVCSAPWAARRAFATACCRIRATSTVTATAALTSRTTAATSRPTTAAHCPSARLGSDSTPS
mgnify:CR=1 FL=1